MNGMFAKLMCYILMMCSVGGCQAWVCSSVPFEVGASWQNYLIPVRIMK